jgi:hypothetical protein
MILITVIERSELEGIFGVVVHRCGIDSPRSGPALNNLLEQHPSVSSVRAFECTIRDSRLALKVRGMPLGIRPLEPVAGLGSFSHFRRFFLFFLWKHFFILSASGLALVWHLRRRHRRLLAPLALECQQPKPSSLLHQSFKLNHANATR